MKNTASILFEKYTAKHADGLTYRGILFEIDEETGAKSVKDIWETSDPRQCANIGAGKYDFDIIDETENYPDVNFGRAKRIHSRLLKIIESLETMEK